MARNSSLASNHHSQGPGDAPRKRKGRKSQANSVDFASGTKRAASPIPEETTVTKKTRRTQIDIDEVDDHDQLARELEESATRSQTSDTYHLETRRSQRRNSAPPAAITEEDDEHTTETTPPPATQPLPGLTPHLDRIGAKRGRPSNAARRARMSMPAQLHITDVDEAEGGEEVQFAPLSAVLDSRVKRRLRRRHLSEEVNHIEDHKKDDARLRKEYAEVRQQLRDMEEKYRNLELELETTRLGNIDMSEDQHEEHEQHLLEQLEGARQEIEELKTSSLYIPSSRGTSELPLNDDMDDDDDLVLVEPADLHISQEEMDVEPLPNGFYATRALETTEITASQVTIETLESLPQTTQDSIVTLSQPSSLPISDKLSDHATQRYEDEIGTLAAELGTIRGALRVMTIQLQNMRILAPGANANEIITELRHVLEHAREQYEQTFRQSTGDLTSSDFIRKMIEELKGLHREIVDKVAVAEKYHQTSHLLRQQNSRLLDLQADTTDERNHFAERVDALVADNEAKDREIIDLDDRLTTLNQAVEEQDQVMREHEEKINELEVQVTEKETDNERIRNALETYRIDLDTTTATVTRLEQEHAAEIEQMENVHADELAEFRTQLDDEVNARDAAEEDAQQKADYINELESRVDRLEADIEEVTVNTTTLGERLAAETEVRENAEGERDENAELAYARAVEVENLTETIQDLEGKIAEFRQNLDTERDQRQQTEADLDAANESIQDLEQRLHDSGVQANELRLKLFQVQQEKDAAIAQLREDAAAAAEESQELLDVETQRRQDGEAQVAQLEATIVQLETDLATTENALSEMTDSRNVLEINREEQITTRDRQLEDLQKKYAALEATSSSTINSLQATITDLTNQINTQKITIQELRDAAVDAADLHATELADRDASIVELETSLGAAQEENKKLADENESLAQRVEDEANELLNIMGAHTEQAQALNTTINVQTATIKDLKAVAAQNAEDHAEQLKLKAQEIEELTITSGARGELIVALELQIEELKQRFREQAEDSQSTIDALVATNRDALAHQERLAAETKKRTEDALNAVKEMKVKGIEIKAKDVDLRKVVHGKVTKVTDNVKISKKKRGGLRKSDKVRDSGFVEMLSDNELDELENGVAA